MVDTKLVLGRSTAGSPEPSAWPEYAALGIAALSLLVALVLGVRNSRTAKHALELSERQEARREARVDLYLNEAVSWRRRAHTDRVVGFHLLATNPSDRASSLVAAELHLTYSLGGILTTVKVPRLTEATPIGVRTQVVPIDLPAALDANKATHGWFMFRIPDGLTHERPVERYRVVVRDSHGIEESVQANVLREERDD